MARLLGVDIPNRKKIAYSLRYVYGIGPTRAQKILEETGIDPDILVEQAELTTLDQNNRRKESDLRGAIDNDQVDVEKKDNKQISDNKEEEDTDYQLTRAFDLILASNLIK